MNLPMLLLTLCQGLFMVNNVTFIAINGLVGLSLAPQPWMATLPVAGYVAGGALAAGGGGGRPPPAGVAGVNSWRGGGVPGRCGRG
jgi:hypothetical protein